MSRQLKLQFRILASLVSIAHFCEFFPCSDCRFLIEVSFDVVLMCEIHILGNIPGKCEFDKSVTCDIIP